MESATLAAYAVHRVPMPRLVQILWPLLRNATFQLRSRLSPLQYPLVLLGVHIERLLFGVDARVVGTLAGLLCSAGRTVCIRNVGRGQGVGARVQYGRTGRIRYERCWVYIHMFEMHSVIMLAACFWSA